MTAAGRSSKAAQAVAETFQWQAAMGAISGATLAEAAVLSEVAVASEAMLRGNAAWGERAAAAVAHAEAWLGRTEVPIDLASVEAIAVAVGLSSQASPLLAYASTVELIDHVRAWMNDEPVSSFVDPALAAAAQIASEAPDFNSVIASASTVEQAILVGGLYGLRNGIGGIPARMVSTLTDPDGRNARRYLARLTDRLLGIRRNDWYDPRNRRGPKQVLPGLWLTNLFGLTSFVQQHPDGLVLSLCDIEGRIDDHAEQITFHIDDTPNPRPNPSLQFVIDDVLAEVSAARKAGQPVVLHCRHGASRTGLILRLLLVEEQGLSPADALTEAQCLWPHTSSWNKAWKREIERRATK